WPNDPREHALFLSDYIRKSLVCIDSTGDQPVIAAMSVLISKFQNTPKPQRRLSSHYNYSERPRNDSRGGAVHGDQSSAEYNNAAAHGYAEPGDQSSSEGSCRDTTNNHRTSVETNDIAKAINDTTKMTTDMAKVVQCAPPSKASYMSALSSNALLLADQSQRPFRHHRSFKRNLRSS
ncbi:hypothetical protein BJ878DRAFT_561427, partial [Calycina marina]